MGQWSGKFNGSVQTMARGPVFVSEASVEHTTPTCLHITQTEIFVIWSFTEKIGQPAPELTGSEILWTVLEGQG